MYKALLVILASIISNEAKIIINITAGKNVSDIRTDYSGFDREIIGYKEIELFKIDKTSLKKALKNKYSVMPSDVYLKSPTPWGDLYKTYKWEQVSRIVQVKSAKVKQSNMKSTVILGQDFENTFTNPIKVNAGISQTVENTVTTSWSTNKEATISQEIEYDLNVILAKISGTTSFSYTSSWGKSEEKSESVTLGTTSSLETELQPGQSAVAVLSANRFILEIEVEYEVTLRGNVAVNFRRPYKDHHFYGPSISSVLKAGGLKHEATFVENIQLGLYTDASLKVYDKVSGLPL